ncbi:MAG: CHAT domain-containing protein [Microbacterium gubbeenense]
MTIDDVAPVTEAASPLTRAAPRTRLTATALHARGIDESNRLRFARAERTFRLALRRAPDDDTRARVRSSLAYVLARRGAVPEAEVLCRGALDLRDVPRETRGRVLGQFGAVLLDAGRLDEARGALSEAIEMLEDAPDLRGNVLMNRSVVAMRIRDIDLARSDLAAAAACFETTGDELAQAQATHNLGYVLHLAGDIVAALRLMAEARPVAAAASAVARAICDADRAEVLREAGDTIEAERVLRDAAREFGAERMGQSRAEAEIQLAFSLLTHDRPEARRVARAAARRFRRLGSHAWAARADAVALRAALAGDDVRARSQALGLVAGARTELRRYGFSSEARALAFAAATASTRMGLKHSRLPARHHDDPLDVRLLAHAARAARAAARGDDAGARRHAAAGLEDLSNWQSAFGSLDLLSSVAMHGSGVLIEGVSGALRSRRPDTVFEWSERARHFTQQVTPVRPPPDAALAVDLTELRVLKSELVGTDWFADRRVHELRYRIADRQWTTTPGSAGPPRARLDEMRAELGDDTTMLAFVYVSNRLACLAVNGQNQPVIVDLSWERIRSATRGLRTELEATALLGGPAERLVRAALDSRLAQISKLLVEPVLAAVGGTDRIVITAPGELHRVPWVMLPALRGRTVTVARSASRWLHARTQERRAADPIPGFVVGPGVARGAEEVDRAAKAWAAAAERRAPGSATPARVLTGDRAGTVDVASLAHDVDVLHVVAHGEHAAYAPMLSGLTLTDGILFGYDIDQIPRAPETVVLSACEVGRSQVRWGEEAIGMMRAWLHAGTRCVIASPVIVADDVACELLAVVHEGLAAHLEPAEALAAATERTGLITPFAAYGTGF